MHIHSMTINTNNAAAQNLRTTQDESKVKCLPAYNINTKISIFVQFTLCCN